MLADSFDAEGACEMEIIMLSLFSLPDTREDREKFTDIYREYQQLLWYAANSILHDASLAEDAVQDTYVSLLHNMDCISTPICARTRSFLLTCVKRKAIDLLRKRKSRGEEALDDDCIEAAAEDTLDAYLQKESSEEILAAVKSLPQNHRTMLEYRYVHELSEKQIAMLLGIPDKRVNVAVFRARQKLKALLEEKLKKEKE